MSRWSNNTMAAITTLAGSVDGAHSVYLKRHGGEQPKGTRQDYEGPPVHGVRHEWVNQYGPGFSGDDFHGTVTFALGDYHLIVGFHT